MRNGWRSCCAGRGHSPLCSRGKPSGGGENTRGEPTPGAAPRPRGSLARRRGGRLSSAEHVLGGMGICTSLINDFLSTLSGALAPTQAASSRASATTICLAFLPRAPKGRERLQRRPGAFQLIAGSAVGTCSKRSGRGRLTRGGRAGGPSACHEGTARVRVARLGERALAAARAPGVCTGRAAQRAQELRRVRKPGELPQLGAQDKGGADLHAPQSRERLNP